MPLYAAELKVRSELPAYTNEPYVVTLYADTHGEVINALEAALVLDGPVLVEDIFHGDSIVALWVEQPFARDATVRFSGIIPGGFGGIAEPGTNDRAPGKVLELVLRPQAAGTLTVRVESATMLLHDGVGTPRAVPQTLHTVTIQDREGARPDIQPGASDQTPPILASYTYLEDDTLPHSPVLVFDARDDATGIAYVEVAEGTGARTRATSPYSIQQGDLPLTIILYDKAGNSSTFTLPPAYADTSTVEQWYGMGTYAAALFAMLLLVLVLYVRRKRSHT
jgi:hypothetical protein